MNKNPYNICTFNSNTDCNKCKNQYKLDCKLDKNQQKISMLVVFSAILLGTFGLLLTSVIINNWLLFLSYIVFVVLFIFVIENRITCSHCPYYAGNNKRLDCPGNNIFPKIWKYHPEPMNSYEKFGSAFGFVLIGGIPLFSLLYGFWFFLTNNPNASWIVIIAIFGILLAIILVFSIFYSLFLFSFCKKCINFSCMFNKVPKENRDEYLKRNPIIKKAWEKSKITKGKG
jgi:formate hydrogenlyase subunit 3/multisubunit Na+/H+ antiporter MnhD subunit